MYKCGWQGCEKAYGTLNHLNAHVTMQSHGTKRTPEGRSESSPSIFFCSLQVCCLDLVMSCRACMIQPHLGALRVRAGT